MSETFDDVADFLRAQIHVDKGVALAALADWVVGADGDEMASQPDSINVGAHLVFWSPKRALAECDAKLRIIEDCKRYDDEPEVADGLAPRVLRLLTLPYVDRSGYREEWRP